MRAIFSLRGAVLVLIIGHSVLAVNLISDTNFLYLMEKPPVPTALDLFGPWPIYIFAVELVALGCFWLLDRLAKRITKTIQS